MKVANLLCLDCGKSFETCRSGWQNDQGVEIGPVCPACWQVRVEAYRRQFLGRGMYEPVGARRREGETMRASEVAVLLMALALLVALAAVAAFAEWAWPAIQQSMPYS